MDIKFLEEYQMREVEAADRIPNVSERVGKLKPPIFFAIDPRSLIWSQVAFSGTVICPLYPAPPDEFLNEETIPDIIQFVKDTHKIQFFLNSPPTYYKNCDYLEPLLRQLSPPIYSNPTPAYKGSIEKCNHLMDSCSDEINELVLFSPEWQHLLKGDLGRYSMNFVTQTYTFLRYFGFNEIADTFIDNILINPEFAYWYIYNAGKFITNPLTDQFKSNYSWEINDIQDATMIGIDIQLSSERKSFPEVGSFLMRECVHYPPSLEACKFLINRYEDNDLYNVFSSLNKAAIERSDNTIIQKSSEIGEILNNVWKDKKIKNRSVAINYGIFLSCGFVGYITAGSTGGTLGLLGSMGLNVIDSTKNQFLDQFSELISRKIASPYMATIYDFKKKYQI
jgi:hypothetical protein